MERPEYRVYGDKLREFCWFCWFYRSLILLQNPLFSNTFSLKGVLEFCKSMFCVLCVFCVYTESVNNFFKFAVAVVGCELVGILATPFTLSAIPDWYSILSKPAFSPPNWVFGPAWTMLYFFMGTSAFLIWQKGLKKRMVKEALFYFLAQLFFNFIWSVLFFGLRSPILGLIDILVLWVLILITTIKFYKLSKPASYLLIPYLAWVSFAAILNLSIVFLNP